MARIFDKMKELASKTNIVIVTQQQVKRFRQAVPDIDYHVRSNPAFFIVDSLCSLQPAAAMSKPLTRPETHFVNDY